MDVGNLGVCNTELLLDFGPQTMGDYPPSQELGIKKGGTMSTSSLSTNKTTPQKERFLLLVTDQYDYTDQLIL
jgi:hypothetical protein